MTDKPAKYPAHEELREMWPMGRIHPEFDDLQSRLTASEAMAEKMAEALGHYTKGYISGSDIEKAKEALAAYEQTKGN